MSFLTTESSNKPANCATLELSGGIENLLDTNIVMLAVNQHSTFESANTLEWHGAEKPEKLTKVGTINSLFMLMEPAAKISEQEATAEYEALSAEQRSALETVLRLNVRPVKDVRRMMQRYYIVSRTAAVVARVLKRNLEYMLVPTFETKLDDQRVHVGFVPARLLFEALNP